MFNRPQNSRLRLRLIRWSRRLSVGRASLCAVLLLTSLVLACLPDSIQGKLRSLAATALVPGQRAYVATVSSVFPPRPASAVGDLLRSGESSTGTAAAELDRLEKQIAELQAALASAREASETASGRPLIEADWVALRVLGRQARWRLPRRDLLEAGDQAGIQVEDLVTLPPAEVAASLEPRWLDGGQDQQLLPGLLAFQGGAIFGRIVEVGPRTSTVQRITDPHYRDLVRIRFSSSLNASAAESADTAFARPGPQGVLEGTGEPLCRIRMIPASEPISKGDLVVSAGYEGLLDRPLSYGLIVKAECPADAAHWEIWMAPDAYRQRPTAVRVLRTRTVPEHLAAQANAEEASR